MLPSLPIGSDESTPTEILHSREPHWRDTEVLRHVDEMKILGGDGADRRKTEPGPNLVCSSISLMQAINERYIHVYFHLEVKPEEWFSGLMHNCRLASSMSLRRCFPLALTLKEEESQEDKSY